ncbi:SOS3-interacting protein 1 [Perilla frutescens var. hirtella]|uniref:non-specific serine/threonine protein kinase n=1 Tax=Perilla frutescens var. hirtella TaxID=608512 RepID=A0AAD4PFD4_PERFH|nr:SOS3-interacting protein 1 [Perilla frutescens var. hirtella]
MDNRDILMQKYELGRLLGKGTFAKVYYGRCVRTGQSVAIKVIDKKKITKVGIVDQIKREISIMRMVKHPHIVHLHEVMATKTKIYFVMEYAKGGELFNKVSKGKLEEDVARKYFVQLINAVELCHSRGVYHRDLKPENILLDENDNLKVSDFGLSALTECRRSDGLLHTTCGTPAYVAPEIIERNGYDGIGADIWSCGVVLFVLLAGYLPFHASNLMEMYRKIGKAEYKFPSWFSPRIRRLVSKMLDPNPNTRISIAKIKESSWFKQGIEGSIISPEDTFVLAEKKKQEVPRLLNAFDLISLSDGFDLSNLFEESCGDKESRFISCKPASIIMSKLERVAKIAKLKMSKKDGGLLKFERSKESRNGVLSIEAEIFVLTPVLHLVEVKKTSGDAVEYQKILNKVIRPRLLDIVRSSQDEALPQQRPLVQDEQLQVPQEQPV